MFDEMGQMTQQAFADTDDPIEKLKLLVSITLDYHKEDAGEFAGIMMDFWAEGIRTKNDEIMNIINLQGIYAEYREMISVIIDDGIRKGVFKKVNSNAFAAITIAMLDGIFLQIIMDPEIINVDKIKKTITDTLFSGLINTK